MTTAVDNGIRGLTDSSIKWRKSDGTSQLVVMPTAVGFVYDPKYKLEDIFKRNKLGVKVLAQRLLDESVPEVELDFGQKTLAVLSAQTGYAFASVTDANNLDPVKFLDTRLITQSVYPAAAAGYEGKGVVVDAVSDGSYEVTPGQSVPLTQVPFASFATASVASFAVGADNARSFTSDLIGQVVTIETPNHLASVIKLVEQDFRVFELRFNQILVDRTILAWHFPSVNTKLDTAGKVDDKAAVKLAFSINDDGSGCGVPSVTYLGVAQKRRC